MTAARSADWGVIEIDRDAVRLLIGRVRREPPVKAPAAMKLAAGKKLASDGAKPARTGARGRRRLASEAPVRHIDSRVRMLEPDDGTGTMTPEARAVETLDAVTRYLRLVDRAGAMPLLVAGEELRRTADGGAALSLLAAEVPDPVRLISARRRTELTFEAIRPVLDRDDPQLVVLLERSGTDILVASGTSLADSCTLPLGVASLAAALPDPPTPLEWALEATRLGGMLGAVPQSAVLDAYVAGDGGSALAGFEAIRAEKNPVSLTVADLDRLSDEVVRASSRKIARRTGDDPRRVALLAPGALILAAVLSRYGLARCTVLPQGLRDGVAMAATASPEGWWLDDRPVPIPAAFDGVAADG